jgi:hypothetical protein
MTSKQLSKSLASGPMDEGYLRQVVRPGLASR